MMYCVNLRTGKKLPCYRTKAVAKQAEKAAKKIGCEGSHKMGRKWMPCSMQWYLEEQPKNNGLAGFFG